jgi:ABC-type transport system involved in cytochrome bd biosynthesis fused ATPase/permease subunit
MTLKSKLWRVAGALFLIINLAGGIWAATTGEWSHAAVHIGLLIGAYVAWPFAARATQDPMDAPPANQRVEYLQQSVDAIALEVERLGEAQRYQEKLRAERGEKPEP